jgi:hypothetical protein
MRDRSAFIVVAPATLLAVLLAAVMHASAPPAAAQTADAKHYPDWRGAWSRVFVPGLKGNPSWDPTRSEGRAQEAPLTPEYRAMHEASLADQVAGGAGLDRDYACYYAGMPRMMNVYAPMEIVVTPEATHLLMGFLYEIRRIFTDGRDWPDPLEPSMAGYSIGRWIDEDGDGRYDVLEVETRGFRGHRTLDSTAIPLHVDNATVVKERIRTDRADANVIRNEITVIDHAFTRPWTVTKGYRRSAEARPDWRESKCVEDNLHVRIGEDSYLISGDGLLMPVKKGQAPPDLRYFGKPQK